MTKNEYELLRICRSAELAYFMSEHKLEKPKFIQSWFKNKVKTDREELSNEQIQTICSEWQLKQRTFYKKYRGFVEHFDKVIQNLQYLKDDCDTKRLAALVKQLDVIGTTTLNGLDPDTKIDNENLPEVTMDGLVLIQAAQDKPFNDEGNLNQDVTMTIQTLDAKRFYYLIDIVSIHGFDSTSREKYVAGEPIKIQLASSTQNEFNAKVINYEHSREQDWREELAKGQNKASAVTA